MESARPPPAAIWCAASSRASTLRAASTTFDPARPNATARARPMPLDAPVTIAVFPLKGVRVTIRCVSLVQDAMEAPIVLQCEAAGQGDIACAYCALYNRGMARTESGSP